MITNIVSATSVQYSANLSCLRFAFASSVITNISYILIVYHIAEYENLEKQEIESQCVRVTFKEHVSARVVPIFPHPD